MRRFCVGLMAFCMGCMHHTSLEVLRPADVNLPAGIEKMAVVDRSSPANVGERIAGTAEGAMTNEDIAADRHAARVAVNTVAEMLEASPRYAVVVPPPNPRRQDSTLFDRAMSFRTAREICRPFACNAVVALETFDSDNRIRVETDTETFTDDEGRERERRVFRAIRDTTVTASWRIYDLKSRSLIDDIRDYAVTDQWTGEGYTERQALDALPPSYDAVQAVGSLLGQRYGTRIAPTWVWVNRAWFATGSEELKQARRYVKAGDWQGAAEVWREVAKEGGKDGAKATFNLALYNERLGRLNLAMKRAQKAAVELPRGVTRSYVRTLQQRRNDEQRLQQQMQR